MLLHRFLYVGNIALPWSANRKTRVRVYKHPAPPERSTSEWSKLPALREILTIFPNSLCYL
jgi:hypothetical protein